MGFAEIITSVFGGGLTGLIGAGVQKFFEFKTKKLELEAAAAKYVHEVNMKKADAEILAQEWAARTRVAEVEAAGREAVADAQAFEASLTNEPKRYAEGLKATPRQAWLMFGLDLVRGIVRPALTLYLCGISTAIFVMAYQIVVTLPSDPAAAQKTYDMIVKELVYLTVTCVLWWFGTRKSSK